MSTKPTDTNPTEADRAPQEGTPPTTLQAPPPHQGDFPRRGRTGPLYPVLSDLPETSIVCQPLSSVGRSEPYAILAQAELNMATKDAAQRIIWLWDRADWSFMRRALHHIDWEALLVGDAENKTRGFTTKLLALQQQYVLSRTYLNRPQQILFGLVIAAGLPPRPSMPSG